MKKMLLTIVGSAILAACAGLQNTVYREKMDRNAEITKADNIAVREGKMKRSEYYQREYDRLAAPPVLPMDREGMKASSDMIDVAKKYEAGQITKDEYDSALRHVNIAYQGSVQQIQADANAQANANRQDALGAYLMTKPITTNCTRYGNAASCTTY